MVILRVLQRGVVYLDWPKAPSYIAQKWGGGGGELRGLSQGEQLYTGAQINFGDLTTYWTYGYPTDIWRKKLTNYHLLQFHFSE